MVKHIVMWKIKDFAEGADKKANMARAKELLETLPEVIPGIVAFEVGVDFSAGPASWDLALYSEMESRSALAIYQKHPEHVKVAQFVRAIAADRAIVDYEV